LAARSAEAEQLRRCPDATIADFVDSGLLRICQPKRYGGYEMSYDVLCEAIHTLARGCGSQAWVHMVLADNPSKLASFPIEAQDDVWGSDSNQKIAVALAAVGKAREVDGGIVWNGLHGFSSGIDHAEWVICGGTIIRDGQPDEGCMVVIPTREVEIIDDWHAMGLVGSGSKSFRVQDVFVPWRRVQRSSAPPPQHHASPTYRLPRGGISAVTYTAVAVGVAEGFLDNYVRMTASRKNSRGSTVADMPGIQIGIGQASAEVEAASRMYLGSIRECMAYLTRGEQVPALVNIAGRRNAAYSAQLSMQAVSRLFNSAGGTALFTSGVLQRQFRDVYAASAHFALVWDTAAQGYGQFVLGNSK
jgi:3-hydroxy-9,10-secoandrosta-1,3,5(10)-triene-9,17-dione monooxygenase